MDKLLHSFGVKYKMIANSSFCFLKGLGQSRGCNELFYIAFHNDQIVYDYWSNQGKKLWNAKQWIRVLLFVVDKLLSKYKDELTVAQIKKLERLLENRNGSE